MTPFRAIILSMLLLWPDVLCSAEVKPATDSDGGKRAWSLLGDLYKSKEGRGETGSAIAKAIQQLAPTNAESETAADFLIAFLKQAEADERNGRAEWKRLVFWGGGAESQARQIREELAGALDKAGASSAAVRLATWMLANEPLQKGQEAATKLIERTPGKAADEAIMQLIQNGSHWRPAILMALQQAKERSLNPEVEHLRRWAVDPRESVRAAAATVLEARGAAVPAFVSENGFTSEVERLLTEVLSMLPETLTDDAAFGKVILTFHYVSHGKTLEEKQTDFGWLRSDKDQRLEGMSWHGSSFAYPLKAEEHEASFEKEEPQSMVKRILDVRHTKGDGARDRRLELLSSQGGLTGQFESGAISVPEALLAAWLYRKGDKASAAQLLFPLLNKVDDDRHTGAILRDLLGGRCHLAMLSAFSGRRDYPETLRLAQHLTKPLFDGYNYQTRARELAEQLPRRMEDFKTFVLPTPDEWLKIKQSRSRQEQIAFLCERLRLLNCHQLSQPGGVSYDDEQFGDPKDTTKKVINPWNELRALKLTPVDLSTLAPFLSDSDFMPTFSYWRDFHPSRTLHRVNWLVADLVNTAAQRKLIDLRDWQDLGQDERQSKIDEVIQWSGKMATLSAAEVLHLNMSDAHEFDEWMMAARRAAKLKEPTLINDLIAGATKYRDESASIAELCFYHGSPAALETARNWIRSGDPHTQLFGNLIVIKHGGEVERPQAVDQLAQMMAGDWDERLMINAIDPMLSLNINEVTVIACRILKKKELDWDWSGGAIARRLFLTAHPDAIMAITEKIRDTSDTKERQGVWNEQDVTRQLTRGDRLAEEVAQLRKDYSFPTYAPDDERAKAKAELATWLAKQAKLLTEGGPTPELDQRFGKTRAAEWELDAP